MFVEKIDKGKWSTEVRHRALSALRVHGNLFEFKMGAIGRLYKRMKLDFRACLFTPHNTPVKRLWKKREGGIEKLIQTQMIFSCFDCELSHYFSLFHLSGIHSEACGPKQAWGLWHIPNPYPGEPGRLKTSDWGGEERNTEGETARKSLSFTFVLPDAPSEGSP